MQRKELIEKYKALMELIEDFDNNIASLNNDLIFSDREKIICITELINDFYIKRQQYTGIVKEYKQITNNEF